MTFWWSAWKHHTGCTKFYKVCSPFTSAVRCLQGNMESKHFEIWIWIVRKPGRSEETGDQTNKKRGNQGPIQGVCRGLGGRGQDPFNLPWDTGTGVPLPSPSPGLHELDPEEQKESKRGGGCKCRKERREAGGRMISLGNTWAFLSDNNWQARFHFPALLQGPRLVFFFFSNRTRWSENRRMTALCCTGVSLRLFTLLLLFLFSTKTTAPGLQVNWKRKNWKSCLNISNFHLWHTILGAEKGWSKFIKKDLRVFGPVFIIVPIRVQCWRSAALQTKTQFYKKDALT